MNTTDLIPITESDVEEHVFDIFVNHAPLEKVGLGVYERTNGRITVDLRVPSTYSTRGFHTSADSTTASSSKARRKLKKKANMKIKGPKYDILQFDIDQSISLFTSSTESSTTGAMLWRVSVNFTEWLLNISQGHVINRIQKPSDFEKTREADTMEDTSTRLLKYPLEEWDVVEMGCGSSGLVAAALGPVVHKYLATDHLKQILQQSENNILINIPRRLVSIIYNETNDVEATEDNDSDNNDDLISTHKAIFKENEKKIQCVEFDWEDMDSGIVNISTTLRGYTDKLNRSPKFKLQNLSAEDDLRSTDYTEKIDDRPLVVLACDTVYNEYLIPHQLDAIAALCSRVRPQNAHVIIAQQVRDPQVMSSFMDQFVLHKADNSDHMSFEVYTIPDQLLSQELVNGYTVHYARYSGI